MRCPTAVSWMVVRFRLPKNGLVLARFSLAGVSAFAPACSADPVSGTPPRPGKCPSGRFDGQLYRPLPVPVPPSLTFMARLGSVTTLALPLR